MIVVLFLSLMQVFPNITPVNNNSAQVKWDPPVIEDGVTIFKSTVSKRLYSKCDAMGKNYVDQYHSLEIDGPVSINESIRGVELCNSDPDDGTGRDHPTRYVIRMDRDIPDTSSVHVFSLSTQELSTRTLIARIFMNIPVAQPEDIFVEFGRVRPRSGEWDVYHHTYHEQDKSVTGDDRYENMRVAIRLSRPAEQDVVIPFKIVGMKQNTNVLFPDQPNGGRRVNFGLRAGGTTYIFHIQIDTGHDNNIEDENYLIEIDQEALPTGFTCCYAR